MTTHHQMCSTCGHRVAAETISEAWARLDEHCDTVHGRRFHIGQAVYNLATHPHSSTRRANRPAPLGGDRG